MDVSGGRCAVRTAPCVLADWCQPQRTQHRVLGRSPIDRSALVGGEVGLAKDARKDFRAGKVR